uniref:Retrotransposon gag domain-containing protein n=1 Tax=Ananas comosus var. bracteatus TaxID=296719 RepID=A0A6V7P1W3_ANACO|nr:unnamed protein product [Ananas comosus var. bracteatus]
MAVGLSCGAQFNDMAVGLDFGVQFIDMAVGLSFGAQFVDMVIGRLHELVARQVAAATPVPQDPPAPVAPTPAAAAAPVMAIPPTASGSSALDLDALEAEKERSLAVLTALKRFNPPTFNGDDNDPWVMEAWLTAMEALFEDIYTLERDKVHLAAHCDKRKIKEDFRKLRQGSRSVREYEKEFSHMIIKSWAILSVRGGVSDVAKRGISVGSVRVAHHRPRKLLRLSMLRNSLRGYYQLCRRDVRPRRSSQRHHERHRVAEFMQPSGASNSFIGVSFAKSHDIEISDSPDPWWVYAPEHTFSVTKECLACPIQIGEWIMLADLLVLKRMWGFDVILGLDWLSKYYASIDCESKVITFREPGQKELVYRACQSSRFPATVSASRVRKLVKGGCVAYLATVVETQRERELPTLGDIPKVRSDVEGGRAGDFGVGSDGALRFRNRLCVPKDDEIRKVVL